MDDSAVRVLILMLTTIALIYILSHQPSPVTVSVVPYCEITYRAARKDIFGEWHFRWQLGNGMCSLLDRFEDV